MEQQDLLQQNGHNEFDFAIPGRGYHGPGTAYNQNIMSCPSASLRHGRSRGRHGSVKSVGFASSGAGTQMTSQHNGQNVYTSHGDFPLSGVSPFGTTNQSLVRFVQEEGPLSYMEDAIQQHNNTNFAEEGNLNVPTFGGRARSWGSIHDTGYPSSEAGTHLTYPSTVPRVPIFPTQANVINHCNSSIGSHFDQISVATSTSPKTVRTAMSVLSAEHPNQDHTGLGCPLCGKEFKCRSELKKHKLSHDRPYKCNRPNCQRTQGFRTVNDLDRHNKGVHKVLSDKCKTKSYKCPFGDCKTAGKLWPRRDNFKAHLKRMHSDEVGNVEDSSHKERMTSLLKRSEIDEYAHTTDYSMVDTDSLVAGMGENSGNLNAESYIPAETFTQVIEECNPKEIPLDPELLESNGINLVNLPQSSLMDLDDAELFVDPVNFSGDASSQPMFASDNGPDSNQLDEKSQAENPLTEPTDEPMVDSTSVPDVSMTDLACSMMRGKDCPPTEAPNDPEELASMLMSLMRDNEGSSQDLKSKVVLALQRSKTWGASQSQAQRPMKIPRSLKRARSLGPEELPRKKTREPETDKRPDPVESDNQPGKPEKCKVCGKIFKRPCELRKHKQRHHRPYGCTFGNCSKLFGSKSDWKRHEQSQHFQWELYRCRMPKCGNKDERCATVRFDAIPMRLHMRKVHGLQDDKEIEDALEDAILYRNWQIKFWCGFCDNGRGDHVRIEKEIYGADAFDFRADHIVEHFKNRWSVVDWIDVEQNIPKGKMKDEKKSKNRHSRSRTSEAAEIQRRDRHNQAAMQADAQKHDESPLRGDKPPAKNSKSSGHVNPTEKAGRCKKSTELWTCCDCSVGQQTTEFSTTCICGHDMCENCSREIRMNRIMV